MRLVFALVIAVCLFIPVVSAISLLRDQIPLEVEIKTHQNKLVEFTIRGDNVSRDVEIFAKSSNPTRLNINGKSQVSQNITLGAFEERKTELVLDGLLVGDSTITYGARTRGAQESMVGFEQVVQGRFDVFVICTQNCGTTSPIPSTSSAPKSSGGGGGGSGALTTTSTPSVSEVPVEVSDSNNVDDSQMQSLTNSNSATSEMVVPKSTVGNSINQVVSGVSESISNNASKLKVAGLLLFFSVGTLGSAVTLIILKRGSEK
jgi:hypothetical protein